MSVTNRPSTSWTLSMPPLPENEPSTFSASFSSMRPEQPVEQCRQYRRLGWCRYSNDCPFEHIPKDPSHNALYKTELCVFYFASGSCRLGIKCRFAHGVSELRNLSHYKTKLCRYFLDGNCNHGTNCHFAHGLRELIPIFHPRYKTRLCRHYESAGGCSHGNRCNYAHGRAEVRPIPKVEAAVCRTFLETGACRYGKSCFFSHTVDVLDAYPQTYHATGLFRDGIPQNQYDVTNHCVHNRAYVPEQQQQLSRIIHNSMRMSQRRKAQRRT